MLRWIKKTVRIIKKEREVRTLIYACLPACLQKKKHSKMREKAKEEEEEEDDQFRALKPRLDPQ